jgi:hypothetical protein
MSSGKASLSMPRISSSAAPSNTGVAKGTPLLRLPAISRTSSSLSCELLGLAAGLVVQLVEEACAARPRACCCSMSPMRWPMPLPAQPRCTSSTWPTFIREGTPSGLSTMSHRRAVGHVGHVLDRDDLGHHALVAVAAGHLVARLQAALDGQVDLDHLQHAGGQLVALRQLLALLFEGEVEAVARLVEAVLDALELVGHVVVGRADVEPVVLLDLAR